jgi:hypothetical protein
MFVLVTLLALALGWLGWQQHIVRHRRAMRMAIAGSGGIVFIGDIEWMHSPEIKEIRPADYRYKISAIRRLLGDHFAYLIAFHRRLTADDQQALDAFPEAEIDAIP